jgi:ribonuclease BN (tRNA processing enzyme)
MRFTVLGCSGWPPPGGAASGYLVQRDGFNLLLDCGNGTLAKLQEAGVELVDIGAVCVTHAHPDHFADLYALFVAAAFGGQADGRIPLYGPPGFLNTIGSVASAETREVLAATFDFHPVHPGDAHAIGPFSVTVFGMNHPNDAVGYRVEAGGNVLAYSGDTGPTEAVEELARDADVFVCEAVLQGEAAEEYPYHLSGAQAGQYAALAGARTLILTHLWPSLDPEVTRAAAENAFGGRILVAESGMTVEVE